MRSQLFGYMVLGVSLPNPSGGSVLADVLKSEVLEGGSNNIDWKGRLDMLIGFYGYLLFMLD